MLQASSRDVLGLLSLDVSLLYMFYVQLQKNTFFFLSFVVFYGYNSECGVVCVSVMTVNNI